ncbi:MAG: gliding motility-associated C-terminal domain-containing protein, partial [Chitinophagia bacterium]|nr:gliding motility-associated C-terminal domain-containing protein [Chitinophagia bacterium]
ADSFKWSPVYNLDTVYRHNDTIVGYPARDVAYGVTIYFRSGCIVDTAIHINVVKVYADAGPNRTIADGATTLLGGPKTSLGDNLFYTWYPNNYLSADNVAFPDANPPTDFTYYLKVTLLDGIYNCAAYDTVTLSLNCGDIYLPNAFTPNSTNSLTNRFGIQNANIAQLNYFRIFDRWGNLVFETTNPTAAWDGKYNGADAPVGVYTWIADGFCNSKKAVHKTGNVTLLK